MKPPLLTVMPEEEVQAMAANRRSGEAPSSDAELPHLLIGIKLLQDSLGLAET